MTWLATLLVAVLRAILPAVVEAVANRPRDTMERSAANPSADRWRQRARRRWSGATLPLLLVGLLLASGCRPAVRTVYVPDGEPVMLREDIPDAAVWVLDANGEPIPGRLPLRAGWLCGPVDLDPNGGYAAAADPAARDP